MRREAPAERVEIGQSSGIKFGVDGLGELDFAGTIMSERQQSDDSAARLLFAVTDQQRFEGALIGAAREELLTIDQSLPRRRPGLSRAIGLRRKAWMTCR
jgi:hypothetical protein